MALHMQELRVGRTGRVVLRTRVEPNEGNNARLNEGMRVVTRPVATQAEVCETKEDQIIAPEASEGTAETIDEETAIQMQELGAARTGLVMLTTQVDTSDGDNARLDERMRIVAPVLATNAEECEIEDDEISATEASGGEEGTTTDVRASTSTPPVQQPPTGSQKKAALYFVYSVVLTVVNVYAALATESFSWSRDSSTWDKNVVFGISAVLEASGLAFGVGMSIRHYLDANGRIEWSDTLSMPHIIALEGMLGEGEKGRKLFVVGLTGSVCESIIGATVFRVFTMRDEVGVLTVYCVAMVIILSLVGLAIIRYSKDNIKTLSLFTFGCYFIVYSLGLKVMTAYYMIVSGSSVVNCTLTILNAVAIVPLVTVTIGVNVGWQLYQLSPLIGLVPLRYVPASCVATIQAIDPEAFLSFGVTSLVRINVLDPRKPCFIKPQYVAIPGDETAEVSSMP